MRPGPPRLGHQRTLVRRRIAGGDRELDALRGKPRREFVRRVRRIAFAQGQSVQPAHDHRHPVLLQERRHLERTVAAHDDGPVAAAHRPEDARLDLPGPVRVEEHGLLARHHVGERFQPPVVAVGRGEQQMAQLAMQETQALYAHDIAIGQGASQWVINLRALVRPMITYGLFLLLVFVDIAGFAYAWNQGTDFKVMLDQLWDDDTQLIWASVVAFWFGSQAFSKK